MLVISRTVGQEIVIPEIDLKIRVVEVRKSGVVRLGLEAPLEKATILRSEIAQDLPDKANKQT